MSLADYKSGCKISVKRRKIGIFYVSRMRGMIYNNISILRRKSLFLQKKRIFISKKEACNAEIRFWNNEITSV